VEGHGFAGCGKNLVLGGAVLQRCDKHFVFISGFKPLGFGVPRFERFHRHEVTACHI
jgi:hypothetical protein